MIKTQLRSDWFSKQKFPENVISDKYINTNFSLLETFLLYLRHMKKQNKTKHNTKSPEIYFLICKMGIKICTS